MKSLSKADLFVIFQMATKRYIEMPFSNLSLNLEGELDDKERRALCFLEASLTFLNSRDILKEDWEQRLQIEKHQIETDPIEE